MTGTFPYPVEISSYADLKLFLRMDLTAHGISQWSLARAVLRPEVSFQRALRRAEWSRNLRGVGKMLYVWHRFVLQRWSLKTGISIPLGVFGPGLSIAHYGSVVVNHNTRVGAFCRIHSATNLGAYQGLAPIIGDFVYIGPGAVLYGAAEVGHHAVIGANSVVSFAVPNGATAVGAPGRIVPGRDSTGVMPSWIVEIMRSRDMQDVASAKGRR